MNGVVTMKNTLISRIAGFMLVGLFLTVSTGSSLAADGQESLQGLTAAKVVFDVKKDDPEKLLRALSVIKNVSDRLVRQNVQTDIVITFRGTSVAYLTERDEAPVMAEYVEEVMDKEEVIDNISRKINELNKVGVQMKICSLALNFHEMGDSKLLPGINKVGNSLVSLITYQNKGYAMVVI
jgi:intracellular sulfur oxidation DsrE/DsrF family protein